MRTEQDIRDQLEHLLNRDNKKVDYGMILDLASQLSEHDGENVRFTVDGNLVKRLGEQLVAKKTTALSELIKNSYDAEASKVDVIFENTEVPGGTITIEDDGNGMTKEALIKGFMTISTSDKEDNPVSPLYKRPRAGRKGIGRFSAQKIGHHLIVITRTSKEQPYLVVEIDWQNYQAKSNLLTVANSIKETREDFGFEKGTKLVISKTKEVWSDKNQATTFKYISSVVKSTPHSLPSGLTDPGFKPIFFVRIPISNELLPIKSDDTAFLSEAVGLITANMNGEGGLEVSINGIKDTTITEDYELSTIQSDVLKQVNFKFEVHYFVVPITGRDKYLHAYLIENGGVKLYRNGFYVAPYGERYNDWLGLDDSVRRRRILPPHANTNFIGSIDITDIDGNLFDETSSREGLIENNYFDELRKAAYDVVTSAVSRIAAAQGKKVTASQRGFKKKEKTLEEKIEENRSKLRSTAASIVDSTNVADSTESNGILFQEFNDRAVIDPSLVVVLQDGLTEQEEYIQELIDEKNMYRVLSSSGLAIAEFTHEIQLYLNALTLNGKQLRRAVKENEIAFKSASKIESNIEMLVSYTDYFTDTIRNNSQRMKEVLELRDVLKVFFDAMQPTLDRRAYQLVTEYDGEDFWTKKMHISEISSVLMNLFTNACKAIVRSGKPNGKIKLSLHSAGDSHVIRFEDNGDGIPEDKWGKVFNPLFTTELSQGAYANESQQMRGMGLGLTITQDIVDGFEGEISVVEPTEGYSTCIQVIIPKAAVEEIPENAY